MEMGKLTAPVTEECGRERELASVQDVRLGAKVGVWFLVAYFISHHIPRFFFKKRGILPSGLLHLINIIQVGMLSPSDHSKTKNSSYHMFGY